NIKRIFVGEISEQLLTVGARCEPGAHSLDFYIIISAESCDVDTFQTFLPRLFFRRVLPERSEHRIQVVMKIAFLQSLPLIPVKPNAFATAAVIDSKTKSMPDQILDHAEATLRTVDVETRFGERQSGVLVRSLRQVRPALLKPLPIFRPPNPVSPTLRTVMKSETLFQLSRAELGRLAHGTLHHHSLCSSNCIGLHIT